MDYQPVKYIGDTKAEFEYFMLLGGILWGVIIFGMMFFAFDGIAL